MTTVYASIGNSDDKLGQVDWAAFLRSFRTTVRMFATRVHGDWTSEPSQPWQNACMAFEVPEDDLPHLKQRLAQVRSIYQQDSVAFAVVSKTEFV